MLLRIQAIIRAGELLLFPTTPEVMSIVPAVQQKVRHASDSTINKQQAQVTRLINNLFRVWETCTVKLRLLVFPFIVGNLCVMPVTFVRHPLCASSHNLGLLCCVHQILLSG